MRRMRRRIGERKREVAGVERKRGRVKVSHPIIASSGTPAHQPIKGHTSEGNSVASRPVT